MNQDETCDKASEMNECQLAEFYVNRLVRVYREQSYALARAIHQTEAQHEAVVRQFIGWLSADIPELHGVEVPLLADSWERFKQRGTGGSSARPAVEPREEPTHE